MRTEILKFLILKRRTISILCRIVGYSWLPHGPPLKVLWTSTVVAASVVPPEGKTKKRGLSEVDR